METFPLPSMPLGHRKAMQFTSMDTAAAAKAALSRVIGSLVPDASNKAVLSAAQSLLNVATQTDNPRSQDKLIQEMRTIGTVGEWAYHQDRVFIKPPVIIVDDWDGEYLFDMFPVEAMPPDGRAVKIRVTLRYAEIPLQEIKAEHAPSRTIERQSKSIEFSLVPYGIAIEADLNLIDENEPEFNADMREQVAIVQLSFLKTKKLACMLALLEGPYLDRIFLGKMQLALLDVRSTIKAVVGMFGVLNTMDSLGGLLRLKTQVDLFQRDVAVEPFARMIFGSKVPYAVSYGGQPRQNFVNASLVGPNITESTIADPNTPLDRIFPNLLKHTFVRDPKLAAYGSVAEGRQMSVSKIYILDDRHYGTTGVQPVGHQDYEKSITTYVPNMRTMAYEELTLRDAVAHDIHFDESGAITPDLTAMIKDLERVLQTQGIAHKLEDIDPFVFAVNKKTSLEEKYKNPVENFRVIDMWGDVEGKYLDWDQPARNGRAFRHFVLDSPQCNGMKNSMNGMLCSVFALIEHLSNPDMSDVRARAFLAAPTLQQPDGPDEETFMFNGTSSFRVPDLPKIEVGSKRLLVDGKYVIPAPGGLNGFKLSNSNVGAIDAPTYPYGFGSMPGLLMLGQKIIRGDMEDWLVQNSDLRVLGDFYKFALAITTLAQRCYPECIFLDGVRYTPSVHKTEDSLTNTVIALLSNTMFGVKYPYFLRIENPFLPVQAVAFSEPETKKVVGVLMGGYLNDDVQLYDDLKILFANDLTNVILTSELVDQMKNLPLLTSWVAKWGSEHYDELYKQQRNTDDRPPLSGDFPTVMRREVFRENTSPEQGLFVLRMLLEALSSDFELPTVDDDWFNALRARAGRVLGDATESNRLPAIGQKNAFSYGNARHTISAQAFLQLQQLLRGTNVDDTTMAQFQLFLPANPKNPSQPLEFINQQHNVEFMDYAQTIATTTPAQSPLEAMAFAHPSLFANTPMEPVDDDANDDWSSFFKLARSTATTTGRAMREWRAVFSGYAGTELMFFHRWNMIKRIECAHRTLDDPLERMGAIMVATSRANRQSLEAMLACAQPIPLSTYGLVLPRVIFDTSHMLFTQLQVGNLFVRDYLPGLSTGKTNRATIDSTHDVVTVQYNFQAVAGVTAPNSVYAVPDVHVSQYVRGGDLNFTRGVKQTAHFVNLGGKFTREHFMNVEEGMMSLAGIYHVNQFPATPDGLQFSRNPWPSSVFFNCCYGWANNILKREAPESIQNLAALHRDQLPTGLMFAGTTKSYDRKTGKFQTRKGVGHLDSTDITELRSVLSC